MELLPTMKRQKGVYQQRPSCFPFLSGSTIMNQMIPWKTRVAQGFIATGERVRLDEYFLEGPAIRSPAKDFQVSNSHWDSVPLIFFG
jgi:hypothetical protein